jgi:hypothetical protein
MRQEGSDLKIIQQNQALNDELAKKNKILASLKVAKAQDAAALEKWKVELREADENIKRFIDICTVLNIWLSYCVF